MLLERARSNTVHKAASCCKSNSWIVSLISESIRISFVSEIVNQTRYILFYISVDINKRDLFVKSKILLFIVRSFWKTLLKKEKNLNSRLIYIFVDNRGSFRFTTAKN